MHIIFVSQNKSGHCRIVDDAKSSRTSVTIEFYVA